MIPCNICYRVHLCVITWLFISPPFPWSPYFPSLYDTFLSLLTAHSKAVLGLLELVPATCILFPRSECVEDQLDSRLGQLDIGKLSFYRRVGFVPPPQDPPIYWTPESFLAPFLFPLLCLNSREITLSFSFTDSFRPPMNVIEV